MVDMFDLAQWPRYMFHPEKAPERVETPEEEGELADLDEGWRREPYSDAEKAAQRTEVRQEQHNRGQAIQEEMQEPVVTPPRLSQQERKRQYEREYAARRRAARKKA